MAQRIGICYDGGFKFGQTNCQCPLNIKTCVHLLGLLTITYPDGLWFYITDSINNSVMCFFLIITLINLKYCTQYS